MNVIMFSPCTHNCIINFLIILEAASCGAVELHRSIQRRVSVNYISFFCNCPNL